MSLGVASAGTDPDLGSCHRRLGAPGGGVRDQEGGPGRGAELEVHRPAVRRDAAEQLRDGRGGHREPAVLRADVSAADRDRGDHEGLEREVLQARAGTDHVGDRIQRADLVEVDVLDRRAVHGGLGLGQAGVGALLIGRLGWLSVAENEHYQLLSESNRVQLIIVPPRRGWIVDRKNKPIAINRSDFRVDIIPDQLERPAQTLATLRQLLNIPPDDFQRILDDLKTGIGPLAAA